PVLRHHTLGRLSGREPHAAGLAISVAAGRRLGDHAAPGGAGVRRARRFDPARCAVGAGDGRRHPRPEGDGRPRRAGAWAITQHLGERGYAELADSIRRVALSVRETVDDIPGLRVMGDPVGPAIALVADAAAPPAEQVDPHRLADA